LGHGTRKGREKRLARQRKASRRYSGTSVTKTSRTGGKKEETLETHRDVRNSGGRKKNKRADQKEWGGGIYKKEPRRWEWTMAEVNHATRMIAIHESRRQTRTAGLSLERKRRRVNLNFLDRRLEKNAPKRRNRGNASIEEN